MKILFALFFVAVGTSALAETKLGSKGAANKTSKPTGSVNKQETGAYPNDFAYINAKRYDMRSSWEEIETAAYYDVKSPVHYNVNGNIVNGMNTCQNDGKIYAIISAPTFGDGAGHGVVGTTWKYVEVPEVVNSETCKFVGAHSTCKVETTQVPQQLYFSFDVPVIAVKSIEDSTRTFIMYDWVAFKKKFVVPNCK